jgi:hypothetical protein
MLSGVDGSLPPERPLCRIQERCGCRYILRETPEKLRTSNLDFSLKENAKAVLEQARQLVPLPTYHRGYVIKSPRITQSFISQLTGTFGSLPKLVIPEESDTFLFSKMSEILGM